jgi:hypothetical protein
MVTEGANNEGKEGAKRRKQQQGIRKNRGRKLKEETKVGGRERESTLHLLTA